MPSSPRVSAERFSALVAMHEVLAEARYGPAVAESLSGSEHESIALALDLRDERLRAAAAEQLLKRSLDSLRDGDTIDNDLVLRDSIAAFLEGK